MNPSDDTISHRSPELYDSAVAEASGGDDSSIPGASTASDETAGTFRDAARDGLVCPNCGGALEGRKCKLFCQTPGCGYLVTCSEW